MKRAYIVIIFALVLMLAFIRGDTLYEIAECIDDGSYDTRELVYMIQEHNGISAMLNVGRVIEIPTGIKKSLSTMDKPTPQINYSK